MITCKEAYLRTLWVKLPYGIKHSIQDAIEEGKWYTDVMKEANADGIREVDKNILDTLKKLGYFVYWANDESMTIYRISWNIEINIDAIRSLCL